MNRDHCPRALPDVAHEILARIEASARPILVSHIRLDGDALGSELALAHMLAARGAQPHVVNDGDIPEIYRFLPGASEAGVSPADLRGDYDLAIALDLPTWNRARAIRAALPQDLPAVSIDHHPPIEHVGQCEWVDTSMSSVGEMVYLLARAGGWSISPDAATCLYVALVTDTGRFTFSNTTADAMRVAADLIDLGAAHTLITEMLYQHESPALMSLRAEVMQGLKTYAGGRIALMTMTRELFDRTGVDPINTQEMADMPRSVAGAVVGVLLRELDADRRIKVSLRARSGFDIEPVARKCGGGGHHQAAGCEMAGTLAEVEQTIIAELTAALARADAGGDENGAGG